MFKVWLHSASRFHLRLFFYGLQPINKQKYGFALYCSLIVVAPHFRESSYFRCWRCGKAVVTLFAFMVSARRTGWSELCKFLRPIETNRMNFWRRLWKACEIYRVSIRRFIGWIYGARFAIPSTPVHRWSRNSSELTFLLWEFWEWIWGFVFRCFAGDHWRTTRSHVKKYFLIVFYGISATQLTKLASADEFQLQIIGFSKAIIEGANWKRIRQWQYDPPKYRSNRRIGKPASIITPNLTSM